ncbi:MAG: hypothetical protein N2513_00410 [Deltaproteobacteria bacterium]|nr:hypothetical protein [Deltaproteobacteria bacterium]
MKNNKSKYIVVDWQKDEMDILKIFSLLKGESVHLPVPLTIEHPLVKEEKAGKGMLGLSGFRVGELLAWSGFISEEKVKKALMEQKKDLTKS